MGFLSNFPAQFKRKKMVNNGANNLSPKVPSCLVVGIWPLRSQFLGLNNSFLGRKVG